MNTQTQYANVEPMGAGKAVYQMSYSELIAQRDYYANRDGNMARIMRSRIEEAMRTFLAVR